MRLAFLSDIRGNLPARPAVMADIARRGVGRVINRGDSLSGPLLPQATADTLVAQAHTRTSTMLCRGPVTLCGPESEPSS